MTFFAKSYTYTQIKAEQCTNKFHHKCSIVSEGSGQNWERFIGRCEVHNFGLRNARIFHVINCRSPALPSLKIVFGCSSDFMHAHGSHRWIIMLEKCGRPDLNVFYLKLKISKSWGPFLSYYQQKQHCQSSRFTSKMGWMSWIGIRV